jgi:endonuclease/exonuclease/phosphatase family metal-dependent hydrolase
MRVLTYNIHGWRGADGKIDVRRLARIIHASTADVVGLNEVYHPLVPPGENRAALDSLAGALHMDVAFGVARTPQLAFAPLASYGNALLTRYPLLAHAGHHLTPVDGHEQRGLLEARILLPDGRTPFSVYVTHLDHRREAVRLTQLLAALQWTARDRSRPHLVLGDLNAVAPGDYEGRPEERAALAVTEPLAHLAADEPRVVPRLLRSQYMDAGAAGGSPEPSFPAHDPSVRIDYVFASATLAPSLRWCQPWTTEETAVASDHLPVLAEFDLEALPG